MRRTIVMALLGLLLLAPSAYGQGKRVEILRDCQDGILQGNYTAAELRDAKNNQPTEVQEYSDCGDVLSRAIASKTSSPGQNSNDGGSNSGGSGAAGGGGGGSNSGGSSGGGGGSTGGSSDAPETTAAPDSSRALPTTPQDWAAIHEAQKNGQHIADDLKPVSPGTRRLTAAVGRNGLPGTLVAVLALLAAGTLALVAAPLIRRRGLGPHQT